MLEVAEKFCLEIKATEQNFPVVLFIILCKVVPTFESVNEILKRDYSNETRGLVSKETVMLRQRGSETQILDISTELIRLISHRKEKATEQYLTVALLFFCCTRWF